MSASDKNAPATGAPATTTNAVETATNAVDLAESTPVTVVFEETVKTAPEGVEILRGPVQVMENGVAHAMASIERREVLDYKTKAPTGEKLVYLVVSPFSGRATRVRLKHALGSLDALGLVEIK